MDTKALLVKIKQLEPELSDAFLASLSDEQLGMLATDLAGKSKGQPPAVPPRPYQPPVKMSEPGRRTLHPHSPEVAAVEARRYAAKKNKLKQER